jgi:hypothetical protein
MENAPSTAAAKLRVAALTSDGLASGTHISGGHDGVATHVHVEDTLADVIRAWSGAIFAGIASRSSVPLINW